MIAFPPAKINLGLYVIEKRPDDFHNIETLLYPIQWCDILEIVKSEEFKFSQSGLTIDGDVNDNLCVKAYNLLKQDYNLSPVHIFLYKNIPAGAGLGGGSSDGAHTLLLLNEIFSLTLTLKQLTHYCIKLGSDCAFFLHRKPMLGKQKGDVLTPIDLSLKKYFIVIVMPPLQVSTADAYGAIIPKHPGVNITEKIMLPMHLWQHVLENDFEKQVISKNPMLKMIKKKLYNSGALYSSMTGSGAAIYGIFEEATDLQNTFEDCLFWQGQG